jgi:glycosyltransferase involved in cell wall biosynthesis
MPQRDRRRHTGPVTGPWSTLSDRVVMVARYAERDGIGRYADQLATTIGARHGVARVGIPEGPGDYGRALHRGPRALWLLRDARRGDDVIVHYHPHYYIRGPAPSRIATHLTWTLLGHARRVTTVVHEPDPASGSRLEEAARRRAWRSVRRLVFHSEWERDRHVARFGIGRGQELVVVTHGDFFSTTVTRDQHAARAELGLAADRTILLIIGFLSAANPDKGYDRAIEAVRAAEDPRLELHIVGSPIRDGRDVDALVAELRAAAAASAQIHLHEEFVDDERFDLWVLAADFVLTPYRSSSSSGVLARAHLMGTPVVTSDAGGLAAQAGPQDRVFRDDDELRAIVRSLGG